RTAQKLGSIGWYRPGSHGVKTINAFFVDQFVQIVFACQIIAQAICVLVTQHLMQGRVTHIAVNEQYPLLGARKNRCKRKSGRTFTLVGPCAGKQERSWDTMIGKESEACTD